jgi:hypothetical protein
MVDTSRMIQLDLCELYKARDEMIIKVEIDFQTLVKDRMEFIIEQVMLNGLTHDENSESGYPADKDWLTFVRFSTVSKFVLKLFKKHFHDMLNRFKYTKISYSICSKSDSYLMYDIALCKISTRVNNIKQGKVIQYIKDNEKSILIKTGYYRRGKKHGLFEFFFQPILNSVPAYKKYKNYKYKTQYGCIYNRFVNKGTQSKFLNDNLITRIKCAYIYDRIHGPVSEYIGSVLVAQYEYKDDRKVGRYVEYHSDGIGERMVAYYAPNGEMQSYKLWRKGEELPCRKWYLDY